ncbi:hypothetical protein NLU13_7064 [Sarocladium strictum]|uniref:Uncharacterized protein n=1 Tax=Sarocladium strictum TaxID=5046 RepID=A0AA39GGX1_SARSR|nr:hypothetical protein NLU13_7064 [Sarocladium strictum]
MGSNGHHGTTNGYHDRGPKAKNMVIGDTIPHSETASNPVAMNGLRIGGLLQPVNPTYVLPGGDVFESLTPVSSSQTIGRKAAAPVAICGMAMRLPGNVSSDDEFWDLLVSKKDARCRVPESRYNIDGFQHPVHKTNTLQADHGYFLEHVDLSRFDASLFSMTKAEVEHLDPQHRLLLEITRECLESAGETNWRGKKTGCYIGSFGEDWLEMQTKDAQGSGKSRITGYGDYMLSNRISYEYDFKGPSITVKTACSSSTVCLDLAFKALQTNSIESAIVGGVNLIMAPSLTQALAEQGVLSPNGSSRTFDAGADGYVRGEAASVIFLKRLDDAIRDGNAIRAVVRGTASNFDGKTAGVSLPSADSQAALMRDCYESAGLADRVGETAFVECHGTGTAAGDPIEAAAVATVFGEKGVYIGSVKPNLGHSEGAAGLSSVIKAVLALEKKTIPPNIKFAKPNLDIPFVKGRLQVPLEPIPWPLDRSERVSVNSFGIGGANAHVILESITASRLQPLVARSSLGSFIHSPRLLVCTANQPASVREATRNLQRYISVHPGSRNHMLEDMAYTLGARREHFAHRSFAVANSFSLSPDFSEPVKAPKQSPDIVFVFTGQGAQWPKMGVDLITDFPAALHDVEAMDEALSKLEHPPSWTIEGELRKADAKTRVHRAEFSQPLSTAVQIMLVNLLRTWGIHPVAVVGHSSGEIAAAYACGSLTVEEAITVAYLRGLAFTKETAPPGSMAAVGLGRDLVRPYLVEGVVIACENSPMSVTLSGDEKALAKVLGEVQQEFPDVFARKLKVEMAYHSPHMKATGECFKEMLGSRVSSKAPTVAFFSSQTGEQVVHARALDGSYWQTSYDSPVLFHSALEELLLSKYPDTTSAPLLLEIGPHSALAGPIRQILKGIQSDAVYMPTLIRGENSSVNMLNAVGQVFVRGHAPNFKAMNPGGCVLAGLPRYPWNHEKQYWSESRLSRQWRQRPFPHHDVLGSRVLECGDVQPVWRNLLRLDDIPWCRDHVISGDIIFPAAGYIAMAGEAMRQVAVSSTADANAPGVTKSTSLRQGFILRDLTLTAALTLHASVPTEVLLYMRPLRLTTSLDSEWYEFSIASCLTSSDGSTSGPWIKHCSGQIKAATGHDAVDSTRDIPQSLPRKVQSASWYKLMRSVGMEYGPSFQGMRTMSTHPVDHRAVASISNRADKMDSKYEMHPTALDACIQLFTAAAAQGRARNFGKAPLVPISVGEIFVRRPSPADADMAVQVDASSGAAGGIDGSCFGVDVTTGELLVQITNLKLAPLGDGGAELDPATDLLTGAVLQWKPDVETNMLGADLVERSSVSKLETALRSRSRADPTLVHLERLALLCAIETIDRLSKIDHISAKAKAYIDSLRVQVQHTLSQPRRSSSRSKNGNGTTDSPNSNMLSDHDPAFENGKDSKQVLLDLSLPAERAELIAEAASQVQNTDAALAGTVMCHLLECVEEMFAEGGDMLFPGELQSGGLSGELLRLERRLALESSCAPAVELIAHGKPDLSVLEIGQRDDPTERAEFISKALISDYDEPMYGSYTVAVASGSSQPEEKPLDIEFTSLDISQDLLDWDISRERYDLVIVTDSAEMSLSPHVPVTNLRALVQHGGKLVLHKPYRSALWFNFISGLLPDLRVNGPAVEAQAAEISWSEELSKRGFRVLYESLEVIVASAGSLDGETERSGHDAVTILSEQPHGPVARHLATYLVDRDQHVSIVGLSHPFTTQRRQDVISILDLEGPKPFLADISPERYRDFQNMILRIQGSDTQGSGMLWLTRPCQLGCTNPQYATILGLARTLRNELALDLATLEVDVDLEAAGEHSRPEALSAVFNVLQKFRRRPAAGSPTSDVLPQREYSVAPDFEHAIADGTVYIPRYHWVSVKDSLSAARLPQAGSTVTPPISLQIGKRGSLKSLQWTELPPCHNELQGNEVVVEPCAVGMNFKVSLPRFTMVCAHYCKVFQLTAFSNQDVLTAMGIVEGQKVEGNGLGCECAGIITHVGPGAQHLLRVGDRVCVAASNTYTTSLRTTADHCVKIPPDLSFQDAATMPCVYGTVIQGLVNLARLEKGQSVLIHSACGGIGIAAIQLCRSLGAAIFATVGTEEKVQYLVDTFGIPRDRIFNSRDARFAADVMRATDGRGVDVALNSLSGDLLHATWKCVAEFGCMVDIGKRDFIGQGRLAMAAFEANRSYFGVDLAQMYAKRPDKIRAILDKMMELYRRGWVRPIHPLTCFEAEQIEEAFRFMQKGKHIGKLVVRMPADVSRLPCVRVPEGGLVLKPDASYLLVGGLGGLGRSVASWLVDHGAKHLVFLSRSGGGISSSNPETRGLVEELGASGCSVQLVKGSVAIRSDVDRAIKEAKAPVAGIIQMSMVLRDSAFEQMSHEDWVEAAAPKTQGTWNLHESSADAASLDFFVLFSSISGSVGNPGQANYASANTFLDAFVQYRHSQGLPASVLDVGVMGEVGHVSENAAVREHFKARHTYLVSETELLDSLELAIRRSRGSSGRSKRGAAYWGYVNRSQLGVGFRSTEPIAAPGNRTMWKHDSRMALYRNLERASSAAAAAMNDPGADGKLVEGAAKDKDYQLKALMATATEDTSILKQEASIALIARQLVATLCEFMMKEAEEQDLETWAQGPLSALGMDSLVATELRNWCRQRFGLGLSVLEIMRAPSVRNLAASVAEGLAARFTASAGEGGE